MCKKTGPVFIRQRFATRSRIWMSGIVWFYDLVQNCLSWVTRRTFVYDATKTFFRHRYELSCFYPCCCRRYISSYEADFKCTMRSHIFNLRKLTAADFKPHNLILSLNSPETDPSGLLPLTTSMAPIPNVQSSYPTTSPPPPKASTKVFSS